MAFEALLKFLKRSPEGDGKAIPMAESNQAGGAITAIDPKALADAIAQGVAAQLKPLTEQIAKLTEAKPETPVKEAPAKDAPLTLESITKMLDERDKARSSQTQLSDQRNQFLSQKMKDLPDPYKNQLGSDPTKWAVEEQAIRESFKTDFASRGGVVPNVNGDPPANAAKPGAVVDTSKMSSFDKIGQGLKTAKPSMMYIESAGAAASPAPATAVK
jgi:hypothetical protein